MSSERYSNQLGVEGFSDTHQLLLSQSRVAVVGAGGLGSPLVVLLAAMGIGYITIIDDDKIESTNLNRQVLFTEENVGQFKGEIAAEKIKNQNPLVEVKSLINRLKTENAADLLSGHDVIVDCSDNFATRYTIDNYCQVNSVPMVFGGVRQMEGQVAVFHHHKKVSFQDLFPKTPALFQLEDCSTSGTFAFVCSSVAALQASAILKLLTGIADPDEGKLIGFDLLGNRFYATY